jgi:hypothetical protein
MAQCVVIDGTGAVVATATSPCTGFQLLDATEYALALALQIPTPADALMFFTTGFGLPVVSYMAGWGYGAVLNFISKR